MNRLTLLLVLLPMAAIATLAQQGARQAAKAKVLTRAEFDKLIEVPNRVLLLDVRSPAEVATNGGFPVYLSIQAAELEKHLSEIPKDRPIVTVSNHAHRAGIAADLLASKGFTIAGAIGAQVYESEGGQLVKYHSQPAAPQKP